MNFTTAFNNSNAQLTTTPSSSSNNMAFELSGDGELVEPERLLSDWIELVLLSLLLLLGLPLNAIALTRLLGACHHGANKSGRSKQQEATSFLWLKIHLTIIDLIVILTYSPTHIAWLISYTWPSGEFLCKAMQYSWDFCFHLMSFGVASIAVDRLYTVRNLMRSEGSGRAIRPTSSNDVTLVRRLIVACYLGAALLSLPQWFVWTTVDFQNWSQCTTIWHKKRALEFESFKGERIYTLIHLLSVFWIPFLVIFLSYVHIALLLFWYSRSPCSTSSTSALTNVTSELVPAAGAGAGAGAGKSPRLSVLHLRNGSTGSAENASLCRSPVGAPSPRPSVCSMQVQVEVRVPAWRLEMRSKMFHTTVYVIVAYLCCWMPYNILALATFFSGHLQILISMHLELLRIAVLFNTLLNPFIYTSLFSSTPIAR